MVKIESTIYAECQTPIAMFFIVDDGEKRSQNYVENVLNVPGGMLLLLMFIETSGAFNGDVKKVVGAPTLKLVLNWTSPSF